MFNAFDMLGNLVAGAVGLFGVHFPGFPGAEMFAWIGTDESVTIRPLSCLILLRGQND